MCQSSRCPRSCGTSAAAGSAIRRGRRPCCSSPPLRRGISSFPRGLVVDALDIEVHAEDLAVVEVLATLAFHLLAILADDRALERMQCTRRDCRLGVARKL